MERGSLREPIEVRLGLLAQISEREEEEDNGARVEEEGNNEGGGTKSVVPLWEKINNRLAQPKKLNNATPNSSGEFYKKGDFL